MIKKDIFESRFIHARNNRTKPSINESDALLIAENINQGVLLLNEENRITYANRRSLEITGRPEILLIGSHASSFLEQQDRDIFETDLKDPERIGNNIYEVILKRGDSSTISAKISFKPIFDSMGSLCSSAILLTDISREKYYKEHISSLSQELTRAREYERKKIAYDIHDDIAQNLSYAKILCRTLIKKDKKEIHRQIRDLSCIIDKSVNSVRELLHDLQPFGHPEIGLPNIISRFCNDFSDNHGINVDFLSAGLDNVELDAEHMTNLYRLIQEGLNNAEKHADANKIIVRLVLSFPKIILRIEDNGKGFNIKEKLIQAQKERRIGILSMKERAGFLNGEIKIESHIGGGTKILVEFPYEEIENGTS